MKFSVEDLQICSYLPKKKQIGKLQCFVQLRNFYDAKFFLANYLANHITRDGTNTVLGVPY